jgi:hypothetical protein
MKTIIRNENNWSLYIFEDSVSLSVNSDSITTPNFIIGDLNSSNVTVVENVTPPSDWTGCKYIYADSTWTLNSEWTEPSSEQIGG